MRKSPTPRRKPLRNPATLKEAAGALLSTLPDRLQVELGHWQHGYIVDAKIPADKAVERNRALLRRHYAPLLAALPPRIRLYRGEDNDEAKQHRVFLSWTDHYAEAEGFGGSAGVVRVADVPKSRILAVLPHGKGLEWLVTAGPIRGEKVVHPTFGAYVEVDPRDENTRRHGPAWGWLPGTKEKAKVHAALVRYGATDIRWKPRRMNDDDYWSGYPPAVDHGLWLFRAPRKALAMIQRAGSEVHLFEWS